jgi:hypothetical protein
MCIKETIIAIAADVRKNLFFSTVHIPFNFAFLLIIGYFENLINISQFPLVSMSDPLSGKDNIPIIK